VLPTDLQQEWQTMLRLIGVVTGQGPNADVAAIDDSVATQAAARLGIDPAVVAGRTGPARLIDLMLRAGPYDITLADLEAQPHGIDLGPLQPRIPDVLATPSGTIELAPLAITEDVPRLLDSLDTEPTQFVLIGRRQLSSNNSWMHNLPTLVRGANRCTAQLHPEDADKLGLADGASARVASRTGAVTIPIEITDTVRPGVVSIPHGWGHGLAGTRSDVANAHAGVNSNVLADDQLLDGPSGTAVLNGIPVEVTPA
jgi:anaerobic selenocysteine-containing dehydrogenase